MQLWTASIADSHDACCGCTKPITHLLSLLFPPDHKDRNLTIQQILDREIKQSKCLFGGEDERDFTGETEGHGKPDTEKEPMAEEEEISNTEIEELLAAAAADDIR